MPVIRALILAAALALPLSAAAQTPPPVQQAMGAEIMDLMQAKIALRAQIVQLQAEIEALKAQKTAEQK